jgi:hypothetical protein
VNLAPAVPATAREIVFVSGGEIALPQSAPPQHVVVADLGHGVRILYGAPAPVGPGGGTAAVDGGHELLPLEVVDGVMAIGDYDRDGPPDVLVLGAEQTMLLRGIDDTASGLRFESVAFEGIPVFAAAAQAGYALGVPSCGYRCQHPGDAGSCRDGDPETVQAARGSLSLSLWWCRS